MPVADHLEPRHVGPSPAANANTLAEQAEGERRCHFDIYRVERVSLTSIFFSGGDWRWTFCAPSGATLARSDSYRTEAACRSAVAALQEGAASATLQRGQGA